MLRAKERLLNRFRAATLQALADWAAGPHESKEEEELSKKLYPPLRCIP